MTLNTVAVAPMPRASERIDTTAKLGAMRTCRTTCRISIERLTNGTVSIVSYSRQPVYMVGLRSPDPWTQIKSQIFRVLHDRDGAFANVLRTSPSGDHII